MAKPNIHGVFLEFEKKGGGLKIRRGSPLVRVQLPLPAFTVLSSPGVLSEVDLVDLHILSSEIVSYCLLPCHFTALF